MCMYVCIITKEQYIIYMSKDRVFGAEVYHVWVVCLIFQYNLNKSLGEDAVSIQGIFLQC
jgi:hypothetical protein